MSGSILHIVSVAIYLVAYGSATVYAELNDLHRFMCPIYGAITLAALLQLIVLIVQQRQRETEQGRDQTRPGSPIASAKRITYYDHVGEPYMTEWVPIPDLPLGIVSTEQQKQAKKDREDERPKAA